MRPLFSIIIPTYNRALKLQRAIESIERQTFRDFELIVCDDGSTDGTRDVVASFKDRLNLTYLHEENWGGPAKPRNMGIRAARGEWICFLDADDWWYPEKLEVVSKYLQNYDVLYHDLAIYPRRKKTFITRLRGRQLRKPVFSDMLLRGNCLYNSAVVARKSVIDRVDGFTEDKSLIGVEDFDLWLKIGRVTDRFRYLPSSLGCYWVGDDNITDISDRLIVITTAVFDKHMAFLEPADKIQAELLKSYAVARITQQMARFDEAFALFAHCLSIKNYGVRAKALAMMLLIKCRSFIPGKWVRM